LDDIALWIDEVDATPDNLWREIGVAGLDPEVRAGSQLWCGDQLSADADPYRPGLKSRIWASPGALGTPTQRYRIDLLRHTYDVDDLPLELVEGRNFTLVRSPARAALQGSPSARIAEIGRVARLLLSHPWQFQFPDPIQEGVRFSSNPDERVSGMGSWKDRADGGIRGGNLWFLCVRRIPDYVGFLSDMHWFPDAFRARLAP
jgi:hypothetical protein